MLGFGAIAELAVSALADAVEEEAGVIASDESKATLHDRSKRRRDLPSQIIATDWLMAVAVIALLDTDSYN